METKSKPQKDSIAFISEKSPLIDIVCNDLTASGTEVVFRSENIADGLSQLSALTELPKAIIIDLNFDDKNVLAQLRELKAEYPNVGLIAHGDSDDDEVLQALKKTGVKSYLLIGSDADDFKRAIDKV